MIRHFSIILIAIVVFLQDAIADAPKGHTFDAKLIKVQLIDDAGSIKKLVVLEVNHPYVVTLELQQDMAKLGKKGDTLNITILSPEKNLQLKDYQASYGKSFKFLLSQSPENGKMLLQRDAAKEVQQLAPLNGP